MTFRSILSSPLLHFALLGAAIFGVYAAMNDTPAAPPADAIVLTPDEAAQIADRFTATWQRPPTDAELQGLVRSWALEEALVREALELGLDRGDGVIRQRLALKMGFIAESGAAALQPDDAELRGWLQANADRFRRPPQFAFDQLLLEPEATEADVAALAAELSAGADPATLGRASLLPPGLPLTPGPAIDRTFGGGFHERLADLPDGAWSGPVDSAFGRHLVRVTERLPGGMPALDEIRDAVETEWRAERAAEMRAAFNAALLERYTLDLPDPADVPGR